MMGWGNRAKHASELHGEMPTDATEAVDEVVVVETSGDGVADDTASEVAVSEFSGVEAEGQKPSRKRGRWGFWVSWVAAMAVVGAVVGGLVVVGVKFIDAPTEGKVLTSLNEARAKALATPTPAMSELAGVAITMSYPGVFDQVSQGKSEVGIVEQFIISSKEEYRRKIAVSVQTMPSGKLDDVSGYKYRHMTQKDYIERAEKVGGEPVAIFRKTDRTEETLFWSHKGQILTVSVTSTASDDDVTQFMNIIKFKLGWRT